MFYKDGLVELADEEPRRSLRRGTCEGDTDAEGAQSESGLAL